LEILSDDLKCFNLTSESEWCYIPLMCSAVYPDCEKWVTRSIRRQETDWSWLSESISEHRKT